MDGNKKTRYLLKPSKVALMLDCTERKVLELVRDGYLEGHNKAPGRKGLRIVTTSVIAYIEKHKIPEEYWRR